MINLLPPDVKDSYNYASRNVYAIRWLIAFAIALIGLGAIGTTGLIYMQHLSSNNEAQISAKRQSLDEQKLTQTQQKAKDISNNLKLAVTVLGKEVLFSELLTQLSTVVPSNVRLTSLNISQTTGAIDITASSTSYDAATQLQVNLADPANKIFSKADILSIRCDSSENAGAYPCSVTIKALFADDNPFLFINAKAGN